MNDDLEKRLTALSVQVGAQQAVLWALIRTHPDPQALLKEFLAAAEPMRVARLNMPTAEEANQKWDLAIAVFQQMMELRLRG